MSWRFDPAEALEKMKGANAKVAKAAKKPLPRRSSLATLAALAGHREQDGRYADHRHDPARQAQAIPPLSPEQCQEDQSWPPETQRVFVAVLDHMEGKGFALSEAEAQAYAAMQELIGRKGGLIGFFKSRMPDEVAELLEIAKDVFGDGVEVECWPEHAPENTDQTEQKADLVRCRGCGHFERGQGDRNNALGHCKGQPWDGNQGQRPKAEHRCSSYNLSKQNP